MIDPGAIVSSRARLHGDVSVGPFSVIGPDVEIGRGTRVESHVVIKGPCVIGEDNRVFQFSSIGDDPQDKKYAGETTNLVIGDRNTIREACTINRGTVQDRGTTRVGNDNWIMANVHIAHDCVVGDQTVLAHNAALGGHVHVGDWSVLGAFTAVHQYCHIGAHAITGLLTSVTQDIPAYVTAVGRPAVPRGINAEGLRRRGFDADCIRRIRAAYRTLYRQGLKLDDALAILRRQAETQDEIRVLLDSITEGSRGLIR